MKVKEESEKAGLKLDIQNTKIMASGPITSWQIKEEMMETVTDFIFLGSKITVHGDCRHEIKTHLVLGSKAITNQGSILKSRDITLLTNFHLVKAMVFPLVVYRCESWTIQKAECWRIDAFEPWCWRRFLRVPWTARRSNQSILKSWIFIGRTDAEAKAPILWPPDAKSWPTGKDPDAGKDWRLEEKGTTEDEMFRHHQQLDKHDFRHVWGIADVQENLVCRSPWVTKTQLSDWTEGNHRVMSGGENGVEVWTLNYGDRSTQGFVSSPKGAMVDVSVTRSLPCTKSKGHESAAKTDECSGQHWKATSKTQRYSFTIISAPLAPTST